MAHQVLWTKAIIEEFVSQALLSEFEEHILRTRAAGWTITKQAQYFNCSESLINKTVSILKKKYDAVEKGNPMLPPRKFSSKETYMDTH